MARIKKNDKVLVLSGKSKGSTGTVIKCLPSKNKVLVSGVNLVTKHLKARKQGDVAGIKKEELPLSVSNVMPICSSCKKACRINMKKIEDGKKVRVCNRCKEIL